MKRGKPDLLLALAALTGALAIATGAFGAHGATGRAADLLRTGGMYQLVHAVAAAALIGRSRVAAGLFVAGGALFAFSLDALAFGAPHWIGAVTPFGGLAMIAGWIVLAASALRGR